MSFASSFAIIVRESLEALLIIAAIIAFLVHSGNRPMVRYVHFGWAAAVAAGVLTWFAAGTLIEISGARREIVEGATSLLAAAVLFLRELLARLQDGRQAVEEVREVQDRRRGRRAEADWRSFRYRFWRSTGRHSRRCFSTRPLFYHAGDSSGAHIVYGLRGGRRGRAPGGLRDVQVRPQDTGQAFLFLHERLSLPALLHTARQGTGRAPGGGNRLLHPRGLRSLRGPAGAVIPRTKPRFPRRRSSWPPSCSFSASGGAGGPGPDFRRRISKIRRIGYFLTAGVSPDEFLPESFCPDERRCRRPGQHEKEDERPRPRRAGFGEKGLGVPHSGGEKRA